MGSCWSYAAFGRGCCVCREALGMARRAVPWFLMAIIVSDDTLAMQRQVACLPSRSRAAEWPRVDDDMLLILNAVFGEFVIQRLSVVDCDCDHDGANGSFAKPQQGHAPTRAHARERKQLSLLASSLSRATGCLYQAASYFKPAKRRSTILSHCPIGP